MEPTDPVDLERSLSALLQRLRSVPHLPAEMARARREFFGADRPAYAEGEAAMASALLRFGEWYALERESDVMGEIPLEGFRRRGTAEAEPTILYDSTAGVFLVERLEDGRALIRDLQDQQRLELIIEPDTLGEGDLLAGRLYRNPGGAWLPSPVLGIRGGGAAIGKAFQRDLAKMNLQRRLNQAELEHLLFRGWGGHTEPLERLEARLEELLAQGGAVLDPTSITDALRNVPSPGPVIGPLMDGMAAETRVDLEQVRRVLVDIWNLLASSRPRAESPPPADRTGLSTPGPLGRSLARRIEEGLARHEDIEELFAAVGEMLGEDLTEEEDAVADAPTDVGDLEPLVREFLWETGEDNGPAAVVLHRLVALQNEAPVPKIDLEYLDGQDLLRLLLLLYLESAPEDREDAVRSAHEVLTRFYRWAERTQEYELSEVIARCNSLIGDVRRIANLSLLLSTRSDRRREPCLMRVHELRGDAVSVQIHGYGDSVLVAVPEAAAADLRYGDLLLGSVHSNGAETATLAGMVVVVPGDLEQLLG